MRYTNFFVKNDFFTSSIVIVDRPVTVREQLSELLDFFKLFNLSFFSMYVF
jgi:hypothetical protein